MNTTLLCLSREFSFRKVSLYLVKKIVTNCKAKTQQQDWIIIIKDEASVHPKSELYWVVQLGNIRLKAVGQIKET